MVVLFEDIDFDVDCYFVVIVEGCLMIEEFYVYVFFKVIGVIYCVIVVFELVDGCCIMVD